VIVPAGTQGEEFFRRGTDNKDALSSRHPPYASEGKIESSAEFFYPFPQDAPRRRDEELVVLASMKGQAHRVDPLREIG
jgi:hypothetical protein